MQSVEQTVKEGATPKTLTWPYIEGYNEYSHRGYAETTPS